MRTIVFVAVMLWTILFVSFVSASKPPQKAKIVSRGCLLHEKLKISSNQKKESTVKPNVVVTIKKDDVVEVNKAQNNTVISKIHIED